MTVTGDRSSAFIPRKHFLGVCLFALISTVYALSVTFGWVQPLAALFVDTQPSFDARIVNGDTPPFADVFVAAEAGNQTAQRLLGEAYTNGQHGEVNLVEAFRWYLAAAEQGDAQAQAIVAALYAYGRGVKQDYAQAAEWSARSAANAPPENPADSTISND